MFLVTLMHDTCRLSSAEEKVRYACCVIGVALGFLLCPASVGKSLLFHDSVGVVVWPEPLVLFS